MGNAYKPKSVGYLDIETADWTTFVVGGTLREDDLRLTWHDVDSYCEILFERPSTEWRAHNGGRFDFLLVLEYAQRKGYSIQAVMRGASVVKAVVKSGSDWVSFVDTFALAPISLDKFAKCAGLTQKGSIDYDAIRPDTKPNSPLGRQLADYLTDDLRALRDADLSWRGIIRQIANVEPSLTLGSTAWKSASKFVKSEDVLRPLSDDEYANSRAGYFGGRVEVFQQFVPIAYTCDRNSSYPAALVNQPVPVGRRKWGRTLDEEGTVWARVKVPDVWIPPLPVRMGPRLVFPTGTFDGVWTALELRNAVSLGVRVEEIYKSRTTTVTSKELGNWCARIWEARTGKPAWNGLIKLLANSLTGKLAQQPDRESLAYGPADEMEEEARQLTMISNDGNVWRVISKHQVSPCARPEWSAYLTAEARIELLKQIHSTGESAVYSDTDSVFSTEPITRRIGLGLGEWKDEGKITGFESHGPKFYKYDGPDKQVTKVKGQSKISRDGFDALIAGEKWTRTAGAISLKTAINRFGLAHFSTNTQIKGSNRNTEWVGGRRSTRSGRTLPPTHSQAQSAFGPRRAKR